MFSPSSRKAETPSHIVNLFTGIGTCAWSCMNWIECDTITAVYSFLVLFTTIVFHGAHVMGRHRWADAVFMKYDFTAVVLTSTRILWKIHPDWMSSLIGLFVFVLWWSTFTPMYTSLPFNPIASIVHAAGFVVTNRAISRICV